MGFDAVMTVVDLVSKTVHFILTHTTVTTEDIAQLFLYHLYSFSTYIVSNHKP